MSLKRDISLLHDPTLRLMMMSVFWTIAADLLSGHREDLLHKTPKEIYHYSRRPDLHRRRRWHGSSLWEEPC